MRSSCFFWPEFCGVLSPYYSITEAQLASAILCHQECSSNVVRKYLNWCAWPDKQKTLSDFYQTAIPSKQISKCPLNQDVKKILEVSRRSLYYCVKRQTIREENTKGKFADTVPASHSTFRNYISVFFYPL